MGKNCSRATEGIVDYNLICEAGEVSFFVLAHKNGRMFPTKIIKRGEQNSFHGSLPTRDVLADVAR